MAPGSDTTCPFQARRGGSRTGGSAVQTRALGHQSETSSHRMSLVRTYQAGSVEEWSPPRARQHRLLRRTREMGSALARMMGGTIAAGPTAGRGRCAWSATLRIRRTGRSPQTCWRTGTRRESRLRHREWEMRAAGCRQLHFLLGCEALNLRNPDRSRRWVHRRRGLAGPGGTNTYRRVGIRVKGVRRQMSDTGNA